MASKKNIELKAALKRVRQERKESWSSDPPQTLEEELKRQDQIQKRFMIKQECLRGLRRYYERERIRYQKEKERKAQAKKLAM